MALNSLFCADVPLSNYSLTPVGSNLQKSDIQIFGSAPTLASRHQYYHRAPEQH